MLGRAVAHVSFVVAAAVLATSCGSGEPARTGVEDVSVFRTSDADVLSQAFELWADEGVGGGVAAIRVGGGPLIELAAGPDADSGEPLAVDSSVRFGSISKTITSTLVLMLADRDQVVLDATLDTYLPDAHSASEITVRQLLSHRTGIPNYTDNPAFIDAALARPERSAEPDDIVSFAGDGDLDFDPGSRFEYSNTNYILLGQLIEAITGQTLDVVFTDLIGDPLGLTRTSFDDGSRTDVAGGYTTAHPSGVTGTQSYRSIASSAWAAGALVGPVGELATFIEALFDGRLLGSDLLAEMMAPLESGEAYGLGIHPGSDFGVGHDGAIIGFASTLQYDAISGDLLIVVVNNDLRSTLVAADALLRAAPNERA